MNFEYEHQLRILSDRDDYQDRHLRSIRHLFKTAQENGSLGPRPPGWLETMIYLGYGVALADSRDRIVGFSVVRPMGIDEHGDLVTYGECTLTRGDSEYYHDIVCSLANSTIDHAGKHCWGAFFRANRVASEIFSVFSVMQPGEVPHCVHRELMHYPEEDINFIRLSMPERYQEVGVSYNL